MTFSTDLTWKLFTINCWIALAIIAPLNLLIWLWPRRVATRLPLPILFAIIYVLAIVINNFLPDLFDAIAAFGSAQHACVKTAKNCYALGGAILTDNFTLRSRLAPLICNEAYFKCYKASGLGFLARVMEYFE